MYVCEYHFYPLRKSAKFLDRYAGVVVTFIVELIRNGQVIDMGVNAEKADGSFVSCFTVPERESLSAYLYNDSCRKYWSELVALSQKEPELVIVGESSEDQGRIYLGESCPAYVLRSYMTPVVCADRFKSVPLYKLPKTNECGDDYYSLLQWAKTYEACYTLFVNGLGERSGYMQMHSPGSDLSKEGRRLCALLEELSGKPFYYFLFKYYADNKPNCPVCGKNWVNRGKGRANKLKDEHFNYDFVCHTCKLVSDDEVGW